MKLINSVAVGTAVSIVVGLVGVVGVAPAAFAAEQTVADLEEIVVTGTRSRGRSVYDSGAPIDLIGGEDIRNQGTANMTELLRTLVPSFNVNTQPIGDASTVVRPVNLRGLPPDHTLVLVNGKRRHRAAVIGWLTNGVSDGAQGPDVAVIPAIALRRVEVLRDGASAQYGSDAIAGVMNFILKDDSSGGGIEVKYGAYTEGSSEQEYLITGNIGLPFTDDGFFNASFEYGQTDETFRAVQRTDAQNLIDAGNTDVPIPAQNWGNPRFDVDIKTFFNLGARLNDTTEVYAFGNWAAREGEGSFYFRNPHTRGGVFDGNVVNVADNNQVLRLQSIDKDGNLIFEDEGKTLPVMGTFGSLGALSSEHAEIRMMQLQAAGINVDDLRDTVKVAYIGTEDNGTCEPIIIEDHAAVAADVARVSSDPNCESFITRFPGGFTPRFTTAATDFSLVAGTRGNMGDVNYDVSVGLGKSDAQFSIANTVNASLGLNSPTEFGSLGDYTQTEYNFNADFSYPVQVDMFASDLNVAAGFEYRIEEFEITAGQRESWDDGPLAAQGFSVGANGFPGFPDSIAGEWDRSNYAFYLDLEADVTDRWLLAAAVRFEDFDTFGRTTNGKLVARFHVNEWLGLRGTWSTGFRAPTPGQQNASNTTSALGASGDIVHKGTIPSTSPIAALEGGAELTEEQSVNFTSGLVLQWQDLSMTIDYYNIKVSDRIALTGDLELEDDDRAMLVAAGIPMAADLESFRFFQNAFDTQTRGVDVVGSYSTNMGAGTTDFTLAWNSNKSEVQDRNVQVVDDQRVREVQDGLPESRFNFTATHHLTDWRLMLRFNFVSGWYDEEDDLADGSNNAQGDFDGYYDGYYTLDAEVAWHSAAGGLTLVFGGQNITDRTPDEFPLAREALGNRYSQFAPLGFNGAFYYGRVNYSF
ncbi:MAG: TonB-dependent receptor plug domain-containing protein [Pseudohongiellaceae bacterium]